MAYITFKDSPGKKHKCSIRLVRICQDNGFSRLVDFSNMTFNEMLRVPECGKTTAIYIKDILKEHGLNFREKPSNSRRK